MFATGNFKGRTIKTVTIAGVRDETEDEILALALTTAGETKSSLFGWRVQQSTIDPHSYAVELYTD